MDEHVCFALCLPSRRWQLSVALLFYHTLSTAKQVSNYWNKQPVAKEIHVYIYIYTIILEFSHKSATTATQHKATCHWGRPWNAWTYDQTWLNQYLNQGRNKHNMCCSCSNMCLHFNLIPPKHKGALTTSGYMLVTPSQCRSSKTMAVARNFQNPSYIFEGSHIPKKNFHGVFRRGMQGDTPDISATSPRDMKGFDEVILSIWELSGMGSSSLLLGNS